MKVLQSIDESDKHFVKPKKLDFNHNISKQTKYNPVL
jgi:hypothetical protein